jgi:hypothetical protein
MFRHEFPEQLFFICEQVKMMMCHIGGSPPTTILEQERIGDL